MEFGVFEVLEGKFERREIYYLNQYVRFVGYMINLLKKYFLVESIDRWIDRKQNDINIKKQLFMNNIVFTALYIYMV